MHAKTLTTALALLPLMLAAIGCDVEEETDDVFLDDAEVEGRLLVIPGGQIKPYNGRWNGPMDNVSGDPSLEYDATIRLAAALCSASGSPVYTAEWDYYNVGATCTSELALLGVSMGVDGSRIWTFSDTNTSGPCVDGLVDLTETSDPAVMEHTWRYPDGTVDAQGTLDRTRGCVFSGGFGGGAG